MGRALQERHTRDIGAKAPAPPGRAPAPEPGPGRAAALLDLQRASGNRAVGRSMAIQRDTPKGPAADLTKAGGELSEVTDWASDEQRRQKAVSVKAVIGLDLAQKQNVVDALKLLNAALPGLRAASSTYGPALSEMATAVARAEVARDRKAKARDQFDDIEAGKPLAEGRAALGRAIAHLEKLKGVDLKRLLKDLKTLSGNMADTGGLPVVVKDLRRMVTTIEGLQGDLGTRPEAVERVIFLLQSFVAVNVPGAAQAPTAADIKKMKSQMGTMQADFAAVFGDISQLGLFIDFADILVRQLDVRDAMATATAKSKTPMKGSIPNEVDARTYFTSLKKGGNDDVFPAYSAFMQAFFFHKEVASLGDLTAQNTTLLSGPASITGTRPLVCTGYATLGAELMALAGATRGEIIVAIRASDAQLLAGDAIDDGHAIAKFSRGGQDRFISNHLVVEKEVDGIGPNAVAWTNKANPLIKGRGPTLAAAVANAMDNIAVARDKAAARAKAASKKKAPAKKR